MLLALVQHAKLHGKDQRRVLRALVQEINKKYRGSSSSSDNGGGALASSAGDTAAAAAADDSVSVDGGASVQDEDEEENADDDDSGIISGVAAATGSRKKRLSAYPTLLTGHVNFNNVAAGSPPSPSSGQDQGSNALAPVPEPEVTGQLRLLARLQVFCRLLQVSPRFYRPFALLCEPLVLVYYSYPPEFVTILSPSSFSCAPPQLDAPRHYTPRFAALVNAVLARCFGGAPLKQCMGKVTPTNASTANDDASAANDGKHTGSAHKPKSSSSGSRAKEKGAASSTPSNNIDATKDDSADDEWSLNEPVLVPRKDVIGGLLLSVLPPEEDGGASGSGGGGMMMSPTNAGRAAGGKGKPLVSAIWVELQKSDASHRAHSPTAAAANGGSGSGGDGHHELPACPPLPAVYSEPSHWRSPLLTEFAPAPAIQRLIAAVGALHATPWQPHAPASPHGAGSSGSSGAGSFDTHGSPSSIHHGTNNNGARGGGHATFKRVREGWQAGEPMVDLDQFLELLARWCHNESEARVTELEHVFNRAVGAAAAGGGGGGDSHSASSINAGGKGGAGSSSSSGGGDGKLQYTEYCNVMTALNSYIARGSGAGASPGSDAGSPGGGASSPYLSNNAAVASDPDANAPVPEKAFMARYQALHQISVRGGDFLVDAEAFAIGLFRDNHFTALSDSSAAAVSPPQPNA